MKQKTMLVNENHLNRADARARQTLARQMEKHFFEGGADTVLGYVPPSAWNLSLSAQRLLPTA